MSYGMWETKKLRKGRIHWVAGDRRDSNDLFRANINKTFLICKAALTLNITLISYRQGVRCYFSGFIEPHSGGTPLFLFGSLQQAKHCVSLKRRAVFINRALPCPTGLKE